MAFLDPDRRVFSRDKVYHALGGAVVMLVALVIVRYGAHLPWPWALGLTILLGATLEAGQWDAARGLVVNGRPLLGQVGYGFGLLDLAAVTVGALVVLGFYWAAVAR